MGRQPWGRMLWHHLVLGLVLGGIGWYAASRLDWATLHDVKLNWTWLVVSFVAHLCYLGLYSWLWHVITVLHGSAVPFHKALSVWSFSLVGKHVPLKIGMLLLRVLGYRQLGNRSSGPIVVCCYLEALLSLYSAVLVATGLTLLSDTEVPFPHFHVVSVALLVGMTPLIYPGVLSAALGRVFRLLKHPPPVVHLPLRILIWLVMWYSIGWLVLGTSLFFLIGGIIPVGLYRWDEACAAYALAGFLGMVAVFAPSGLGVRDGILMIVLGTWLGGKVALVVSVLARIVAVLAEFVAVGLAWLFDRSLLRMLWLKAGEKY